MASGTDLNLRASNLLRVLLAEVSDLPYRAARWEAESEDNQICFQLEWKELTDRLSLLGEAYTAEQLTLRQRADYEVLICEVKDAQPLMERMRLLVPPAV